MSNPAQEKQAKAEQSMASQNPTVRQEKPASDRQRIPMSVPTRKLEVPEIPGYYTKWIRGTAGRLAQADRAGFTFVHPDEVKLNNVSLGGDAKKDGNTDMGGRVSVVEGSAVGDDGQAIRLYLMKQKREHYLEDQELLQQRNDSIAHALTAGSIGKGQGGETAEDAGNRYVDRSRTKIPEFFKKKTRR